jgi:hypothetical protein
LDILQRSKGPRTPRLAGNKKKRREIRKNVQGDRLKEKT